MHLHRVTQLFAALLLLGPARLIGAPASDTPLRPDPHYGQIARRFALEFPEQHLNGVTIDDGMSRRAWTNYLSALDYDRIYFLAADTNRFAAHLDTLDDELKAGDLSFAFDVFEVFLERVRERHARVEALLAKPFDLEKQETYHWKRRDMSWPDASSIDDLWRRRIKNEYLRRVVSTSVTPPEPAVTPPEPAVTPPEAPAPTPAEFVLKAYTQFRTVLEDSDAEWVLQHYLSAFAHAFDPHSGYMSPSTVEDFDIEMRLSLVGIGALLRAEDGAAKVLRLIPGGPADVDTRDIKLMPGDKIIAVGQDQEEPVDVLHWPLTKIVRLIRGEEGTRVVLVVVSAADPSGGTTRRVDIVRDEVKLEEQAASSQVRDVTLADGSVQRLGVIDLPAFYANMKVRSIKDPAFKSSAYDVQKILADMEVEGGVDGLVLDLRNNGGGSLLEAIRMTGLFIRTGPTVQVREKRNVRVLPDRDPMVAFSGPMVVLVNRLSASASEIVAGALQDYGRAVIVGDAHTHGKGTVQSIVELGRDERLGAVKITTASYHRISGGSTQLVGIEADIVIPSPFSHMELGEDSLPNPVRCEPVASTPYRQVTDLRAVIPALRRQSETRRAADPRFQTYNRLLERVREINQTEELPLDIESRRKMANVEKELAELQKSLAPLDADPAGGDKPPPPDLVLEEGLRILSDLVADRSRAFEAALKTPTPACKSMADVLTEWFQNNL